MRRRACPLREADIHVDAAAAAASCHGVVPSTMSSSGSLLVLI